MQLCYRAAWVGIRITISGELLKREFAVLHVNSFAARGLNGPSVLRQEVCSGKILHGDERAGDMVAVLQTVWKNTRIKPEKNFNYGLVTRG